MRYLFKHILMREAIYTMQMRSYLEQMHRQAAMAIEVLYADDLAAHYADLVHHYEQAQDQARAIHYARIAGEESLAGSDYRQARTFFERALALTPGQDARNQLQLLVHLGTCYTYLGSYPAAVQHLEQGLSLARTLGDPDLTADVLNGLSYVAYSQGDYEQAQRFAEEALALAQAAGIQRAESLARRGLGRVAWIQGAYPVAVQYYEDSLAISRRIGDRQGIAANLANLGMVVWRQGDYAAARRCFEDSLGTFQQLGDLRGVAGCLNNLGILAEHQADYAEAVRDYEKSLGIKRQIGDRGGICATLNNLGNVALQQGDDQAAWAYFRQALAESTAIGALSLALGALARIARLQLRAGYGERAGAWLGLVQHHPATQQETREEIDSILVGLREEWSREQLEAALEAGQGLDLDEIVSEVLAKEC
jgi:tetratricopeptide (TPR) repeat protein